MEQNTEQTQAENNRHDKTDGEKQKQINGHTPQKRKIQLKTSGLNPFVSLQALSVHRKSHRY